MMTTATQPLAIQVLVDRFPEPAKDIKLNLKTVLKSKVLSETQVWGTALACAYNEGHRDLIDALLADGADVLDEALVADAKAVAALMSMNNVYYRFRHFMNKESYNQMPARLRMTRIAKPATDKVSFELFSMAVSAINGCEMCVRSHEQILLQHGVSEETIHDAVRIAAVIRSAGVALSIP